MRNDFVDHCLELLTDLGAVRAARMFGGHGLYVGDLFFALIAFDRLYLKADDATRVRFESAGCEPFVYEGKGRAVTMSYWTAPPEALESPASMLPWARLAVGAALRARAAKPPVRRHKAAAPARTRTAGSSPATTRRVRAPKPPPH